jgi:small conductance mechanosensitive channel
VVGDRIETAGVTGWVQAITGRAVVLTSRDRRTVHIPNSVVLDSVLYNYTDDERRRSEVGFAVAYGYDMANVRQTTVTAVDVLDLVYTDPAPVAYIGELGDDGVNMKIRFYHNDQDRIAARDAVAEAIMTALSTAQIDMPTPEVAIEQTTNEPDQPS